MQNTSRREFLKAAAASLAAANMNNAVLGTQQDSSAGIPTRLLGRTGERVSIVGIGGAHIVHRKIRKPLRLCMRRSIKG